ncbi:RNA-dependent RNA polymerase 1 [Ophiocordyceps camponoti-floridani]|uniref:RNA-dependent RNA polymerase n=1 Tax=Ophiocordyceps camponoti-floridani TaxID=2030778 RepID=A0A8H4Q0F7_9HYPO|nr:RNA-dependent RNA polymerase 1 [Ophiocordyceps camponoti-floridani]
MPSPEGLKRIIDSLNADYGLFIRRIDVTLSPRKARNRLQASADEESFQAEKLYSFIHRLYYHDLSRLSAAIGRFRQLAADSLGSSVPFAGSLQRRRLLMGRLLDVLDGKVPASNSKRSSKHHEDESRSKRPKSRDDCDPDLVDQLPVRSSPPADTMDSISGRITSKSTSASILTYFESSRATIPTSSSRTSSASTVVEDDYPVNGDLLVSSQDYRDLLDKMDKIPNSTGATPQSFSFKSSASVPRVESLEQKFKRMWPKVCVRGLDMAPLPVLWEVTRIFQHCQVESETCNMAYDEGWVDQHLLRRTLAGHPAFAGKALPVASDSKAWALACRGLLGKTHQVCFSIELVMRPVAKGLFPLEMRLSPLTLEPSHRLARRFGADRCLEMTIPDPQYLERELIKAAGGDSSFQIRFNRWLHNGHLHPFASRLWFPYFFSRKKSQGAAMYRIYFFASDGHHFRESPVGALPPPGEASDPLLRTKLRPEGLLHWAVAIKRPENLAMSAVKLFSRLSISHTRTYSNVELLPEQIRFLKRDLGTHDIMNDGLGRMSKALARKIADDLGLSDTPCGYQGRIGSAKGFWIIDVESDLNDGDIWIELYPSQIKWLCDFDDISHRTFEVKDYPREAKPGAALNQQFLPLLEAQARDRLAMRRHLEQTLRANLVADLDALDGALDSAYDLRLWLRQVGQTSSSQGGPSFLAGLPRTCEDQVAQLLDAGFQPRRQQYMYDLCLNIGTRKAETLRKSKLHVSVAQATYLFMVADFWGVLEEGQVSVNFSSKFEAHGFCDTALDGLDVLVARNPAHTLSDMQKVMTVAHPKLRRLKDVIVFSTKGTKPLAALLSGGDYDGDKCWVCWDRNIVDNFKGCPADEQAGTLKMTKLEMTVDQLVPAVGRERHCWKSLCNKFTFLGFQFSFQPDMLGKCTKYKERLDYLRGVTGPHMAKLAALLSNLVDQAKQGVIFNEPKWRTFCEEELQLGPWLDDPAYFEERCEKPDRLGDDSPLLDVLKFKVAKPAIDDSLEKLTRAMRAHKDTPQYYDADLTALFGRFDSRRRECPVIHRLLTDLRNDLEVVAHEWGLKSQSKDEKFIPNCQEVFASWLAVEPRPELQASGQLQRFLWDWDPNVSARRLRVMSEWNRLKASATFKTYHNSKPNFVWRMAGSWLCHLKELEGCGGVVPAAVVKQEMYGCLRPNKKMVRKRIRERGEEDDGMC